MEDLELNLDEMNLDSLDLDEIDLSDFGEVNDSVDFPHIKFSSKLFKEFLKVSKKVCSSGGKDIISKSTCLVYDAESSKVKLYATDFDVYVEQEIECLNQENILTDPIIIQTDILIKLVSAVASTCLFYKKDDKVFIRLYAGDMSVETQNVAIDKFIFDENVTHTSSIVVSDVKDILKDFSPIVSAAVNPAEKRIVTDESGSYANYMFACMKSSAVTGNFDMKSKDIEVIKGLLSYNDDQDVEVLNTGADTSIKRVVFKGATWKYAFLVSESQFSQSLKDNMGTIDDTNGVYVDFTQLYKIVELSSELPFSLGKVNINYNDTGLAVDMLMKANVINNFSINGSVEGTCTPLATPLTVQSKLLRIVLRSFASKNAVKVSVGEKGISLEADSYRAVLYSDSL